MPETTGPAAIADTSPSVASFVGDLYGDFLDVEPESDTGAPPAAIPDQPPSDGPDPSGDAGAPPAHADASAPAPAQAAADADPLEGATPLAYVVNGESRSFEGITRLRDGGGIIDPEAMEKVARVFGERDHLFERSREQFQQIEELGKLTEWPITGANGQQQILSGRAGVEAQRLALGNALVENRLLRDVLSDPGKLAALLNYDEQQGISLNPDALGTLNTRVENAQLKAAQAVRAAMARYGTPGPSASSSAPAAQTGSLDAPMIVDHVVRTAGLTGLTDADKAWAAQYVPQFVRTTTAEDVRAHPAAGLRVGEPMVLPAFLDLIKDRAQLRASTSAQVSTASTAAKVNAANLAAASSGKRPAARPAAPQKAPSPHAAREAEEDAAFFGGLKTAANLMRGTS